jgi:hypothetical protein
MENLTAQATSTAQNAQATATNAVGNVSSTATNAVGDVSSKATNAVGDLQSKIPKPPEVPQLPKLPNVPQLPGVPEFKQKELPIPKKLKNNKFKDKLAAAAAKAKQLAAKGQAAVAGAQAKAQAAVAGAQAKAEAAVATAQEKAQKAVSNAQDKVKQGIASAEEKATATAEKAKQSAQEEIKKVQEGNGGKPLTEEEKDKIVINKTTEAAVRDAKPTQDAAKAAIEKSNQAIGKPDLSTAMKFVRLYETPKNGNQFYIYQQRDSVGIYYASVHDRKDPFSYKIYNVAKNTVESAIDAAIKYCNENEDDA